MDKAGRVVPGSSDGKYKRTSLQVDGKRTGLKFHRLQAFQKYGHAIYKKGIVVRHRNDISSDNSYENILVGTQSQNLLDIPAAIRIANSLYAASFQRKYDVILVKKFYEENEHSYKKTMQEFGISSKGTLNYILKGRKK
jgi:hypothetical protein